MNKEIVQKPHGSKYQLGIYSVTPEVYQWLFRRAKEQGKKVSEVAREIITKEFMKEIEQ